MSVPCSRCGGEGHLVCRPNIYTLVGELYTVDCEDCSESTNEEHNKPSDAYEAWNREQLNIRQPCEQQINGSFWTPEIVPRLASYMREIHGGIILPYSFSSSQRAGMTMPVIRNYSFADGDTMECRVETAKMIYEALSMPRAIPGRLEWLRYKFPTGIVSRERLL